MFCAYTGDYAGVEEEETGNEYDDAPEYGVADAEVLPDEGSACPPSFHLSRAR